MPSRGPPGLAASLAGISAHLDAIPVGPLHPSVLRP